MQGMGLSRNQEMQQGHKNYGKDQNCDFCAIPINTRIFSHDLPSPFKRFSARNCKAILFKASAITPIPYYSRIPAFRIFSYFIGETK